MAGITTVDSLMSRVRKLIRYYVDAEVTLIDTRNNAQAVIDGDTDNSFDTPDVASADVQLYADQRMGSQIRIIIEDGGTFSNNDGFVVSTTYNGAEPSSTMPRVDRTHRIDIKVCVATNAGSDTFWGARLRCNRVADAVMVIMARYIDLAIPGQTIAGFDSCIVELSHDGRASEVEEESWQYACRVLSYNVRMIEARA
jgi:hypothetical protein